MTKFSLTLNKAFHDALDLATDQREKYIQEISCDDKKLAADLRQLLVILDDPQDKRLGEPLGFDVQSLVDFEPANTTGHFDRSGDRIGPYKLERLLGRGGGGIVYLAHREGEFRQQVAIKLLWQDYNADSKAQQRFDFERQLLSDLQHENIARLYDGGTTADGQPYFVMEYVDGRPITEYCDKKQLGVEQRLKVFLLVCGAVAHAHRSSIIHRDLKPSNILVTEEGVVKLVDFGIAKLTTMERTGSTPTLTETNFSPMTPQYASPEQICGDPIATSSDVYSLGVLLYELLTGIKPYGNAVQHHAQLFKLILDTDPPKPSAIAEKSSVHEGSSDIRQNGAKQKHLSQKLRGDLDAIVMTTLNKEPERRYQTAQLFADDITRHMDGKPIIARYDSFGYVVRRLIQRHRTVVLSTCLAAIVLVFSTVIVSLALLRSLKATEGQKDTLYAAQMRNAYSSFHSGDLVRAIALLSNQIPAKGDKDRRGVEWYFLAQQIEEMGANSFELAEGTKWILPRPQRDSFFCVNADGKLTLVDAATQHESLLEGFASVESEANITCVSFSPDGNRLGIGLRSETEDHAILVRDIESGNEWEFPSEAEVACIAFSHDGARCAFGDQKGRFGVWDTATRQLIWSRMGRFSRLYKSQPCGNVRFSLDDRQLALVTHNQLSVWAALDGASAGSWQCGLLTDVLFSPGGMSMIAVGPELMVFEKKDQVWTKQKHPISGQTTHLTCATLSPDGTKVASGDTRGLVDLRDWSTGELLDRRMHQKPVTHVEFSQDGRRLISTSEDVVQYSELPIDETSPAAIYWTDQIAVHPKTHRVACAGTDNRVLFCDPLPNGNRFLEFGRFDHRLCSFAFSPCGRFLATTGSDADYRNPTGNTHVWDTETGEKLGDFPSHWTCAIRFAPDGQHLVVGEFYGQGITIWDFRKGEPTWQAGRDIRLNEVWAVAFSERRNEMICVGNDEHGEGQFQLFRYDPFAPKLLKQFALRGSAKCMSVSTDGRFVAAGGMLGTQNRTGVIEIYDLDQERKLPNQMIGHTSPVNTLSFVPNSDSLVSGSWDDDLRFWNFKTGECLGAFSNRADVSALRVLQQKDKGYGFLIGTIPSEVSIELDLNLNWVKTDRKDFTWMR